MIDNSIDNRLFCAKRLRGDILSEGQLLNSINNSNMSKYGVEQDLIKVSVCAPVRRLSQKTQVFPLDVKAASRNRLTHSLEVAQYSRLIINSIANALKNHEFDNSVYQMETCLKSASLLHDIGNPPFGHFGESLIRTWLKKIVNSKEIENDINLVEKDDLLTFNGNAQGLRLVHSIQDLNLTLGQYASQIKVPFTIKELLLGKGNYSGSFEGDPYSWAYSNAGVFLSEKNLLDAIREEFSRESRHPFASIIEASDDLAYVLADLEDAYDRGLFSKDTVIDLCRQLTQLPELSIMKDALDENKILRLFKTNKTEALFYLRDVISNYYINDFAKAVASNLDKFIQTGEPDYSNGNFPGITALSMLKNFESHDVYNHFEVQTLDLRGASYITGLFDAYEKLLFEPHHNFLKELNAQGGDQFCKRIASRISRRHKEYYLSQIDSGNFSEMYLRIRLLVDYISGMTDTFAESEYRILKGID